jgi:hypothetical protein
MNLLNDLKAAQPIAAVRRLTSVTDQLGVKIPKAITDAADKAEATTEAARGFRVPVGAYAQAVYEAIEAGNDPAADPQVHRLIACDRLNHPDLPANVAALASVRVTEEARKHGDTVVSALRTPFDTAAEAIAACAERIGDTPLTETDRILRHGGDIAAVWSAALGAVETIAKIGTAWNHLATAAGLEAEPRYAVLRLVDLGDARWPDVAAKPQPDAWELHTMGLRLSLATFDEYDQRVTTAKSHQAKPPSPATEATPKGSRDAVLA